MGFAWGWLVSMYQTYDQRVLEGKRGVSLYVAVSRFFFVKLLMLLIITPSSLMLHRLLP